MPMSLFLKETKKKGERGENTIKIQSLTVSQMKSQNG